ncbi:hypothetical protein Y900_021495 [Mycolicibacterium aromaticivorans JS19b1 = JCM 16368]|uniref:Lipoprotein n=1 Tax=Mycolicibacterium aromaticivorans JS19b1 = JCM 16368 TaxID=1440774 RepID=A0A064CP44_9MYCO|nr:hypothetical protein [Mycolicibacterium aromaticivorans]KDF01437.1 hypothetical protein Y900_021495 [Mycolicibacterium aromaticivorans JS19b1 = JCM 16368]
MKHMLAAMAGGVVVISVAAACGARGPSSAPTPSAGAVQPVTESNPAGDIPDNQAFVSYTSADGSYTLKYPEGWARTASGSTVTFSDKYNTMTVAPHDGFYQPSETYARTVEVPEIAAHTPGFTTADVTTAQRSAGPVIVIRYQADSAPNPVTGKSVRQDVTRYEYAHGGRGAAVTLAAPTGSDTVDPWRTITDSFRWLR